MVGQSGDLLPLAEAGTSRGYILGKNSTEGGWNGTIYVSTAYFQSGVLYQGSDERWKDFVGDVSADFEKIKNIPKKYYKWKEDGENGEIQIGTSAQELYKQYPEIVNIDENGFMSVAYDRLAIIALAAIDKLVEENGVLKTDIEKIKSQL